MKTPRKEPCLSWDTKLNSIREYTPQPFSASIHKYVLTYITTEEQIWAYYKYISVLFVFWCTLKKKLKILQQSKYFIILTNFSLHKIRPI